MTIGHMKHKNIAIIMLNTHILIVASILFLRHKANSKSRYMVKTENIEVNTPLHD